LRGRIDAVFRTGGDPDIDFDPAATWELVDWKTGRIPPDREMPQRSLQLAIYRLAWSRLHNIPLGHITGRFVYIVYGVEETPHYFGSEKERETSLLKAFGERCSASRFPRRSCQEIGCVSSSSAEAWVVGWCGIIWLSSPNEWTSNSAPSSSASG